MSALSDLIEYCSLELIYRQRTRTLDQPFVVDLPLLIAALMEIEGGLGAGISISENGNLLAAGATSIDFVGGGVSGSAVGDAVEIDIADASVPTLLMPVTGGRLSLVSSVPVLTATASAIATVYFALYNGNKTLVYNGSEFVALEHGELSQALSDNTKSPAAAGANELFNMYVWDDAGTPRCTRGPAITGNPLAELTRTDGILLNTNAITNGPAALRGTRVGYIATNGSTQMAVIFGGAGAAGGEANRVDIWNQYNRVKLGLTNFDNTNTWANTGVTGTRLRVKNGNTNNGIRVIQGDYADAIRARNSMINVANNGGTIINLIALDPADTSGYTVAASECIGDFPYRGSTGVTLAGTTQLDAEATVTVTPGSHIFYPIEFGESGGLGIGDDNVTNRRSIFQLEMFY